MGVIGRAELVFKDDHSSADVTGENVSGVDRRDEIDPWMLGEDGANLVLMAVQSPIELSHFVEVGVNLAVALCPTDTLAGVLLSQLPRVVSARQA
jgi:hypothetical protein